MDESICVRQRQRRLPELPKRLMFRTRRPAKLRQNVVVKTAFDGKIVCQRSSGGHIGPGPLDMSHDRCQARRRGLALADLDAGTGEGALHNVRATLCDADVTNPAAAAGKTTGEAEDDRSGASTR
jgi:hypothetical protein